MHRTGGGTTRAPRHHDLSRPVHWAVPHNQLLADDPLIEAVRAGRVDEHHSDPVARLLARWRTGITTAS
jgi:hypothetical protein